MSTLLLLLSVALAAPASTTVSAEAAFARATPPGAPAGAAFMTLENRDTIAHQVVSASSPAARVVELHDHVAEDGVMRMRQVPEIKVAPGGTTTLKPGGLHVMLIDPVKPLVAGATITLDLTFEDGTSTTLTLPVRDLGGPKGMHHGAADGTGPHGHAHGDAACDGSCGGEGGCTCGGSCDGSCKGH